MADNNSKFEDTVQCSLFHKCGDPKKLNDLCEDINKVISSLSKDYIWHRDEFKVCVSLMNEEKAGVIPHITSTTCFGDNIEDEWFIVYLIFNITNQFKDLVVHMEDNDGNFLLIEAADYLPSWANPETTENRVFIYQSQIHLITPEIVQLDTKLNLNDAVKLVTQKNKETKASKEIHEAILNRITCYPQKIKDNQHRALINLPVNIATILTLKPSLISPLVTTYCNHDLLDTKCFKNYKFESLVTIPVLFTKYLYAMLLHSKLPRLNKFAGNLELNKETALGWKLACGYEIIMSQSSNDIYNSTSYSKFINSLKSNGYFKDNIEGSKQYKELLATAQQYFLSIECPLPLYYCNDIVNLINSEKFITQKDFLLKNKHLNVKEIDSEDWLNINPEKLNTFLNTHYGKKIVQNGDSISLEIKSELVNFLKQPSDFEGIEYVKEEEDNQNQIDFDSEQFMSNIVKMLKIVTGGNCDENVNMNDFSDDEGMFDEEDLDKEIASELKFSEVVNDENIVKNLLQSIKEEGTSGPSSNILKNICISKTELLDSDDD